MRQLQGTGSTRSGRLLCLVSVVPDSAMNIKVIVENIAARFFWLLVHCTSVISATLRCISNDAVSSVTYYKLYKTRVRESVKFVVSRHFQFSCMNLILLKTAFLTTDLTIICSEDLIRLFVAKIRVALIKPHNKPSNSYQRLGALHYDRRTNGQYLLTVALQQRWVVYMSCT